MFSCTPWTLAAEHSTVKSSTLKLHEAVLGMAFVLLKEIANRVALLYGTLIN